MFLLLLLPLSSLSTGGGGGVFTDTSLLPFLQRRRRRRRTAAHFRVSFVFFFLFSFVFFFSVFPRRRRLNRLFSVASFSIAISRFGITNPPILNLFSSSVLYIIEEKKRLLLYQNARDVDAINPKNNKGEREREELSQQPRESAMKFLFSIKRDIICDDDPEEKNSKIAYVCYLGY